MDWMQGATNEHTRGSVSEEQRSRRPNMSLPKGAGRFSAVTASLVAHISQDMLAPRSLFRSKICSAKADIILVRLIKYDLVEKRFRKEKEVDVQLATDLLEFRNNYDAAIIISGDQDFVPAVKVIKNSGKLVANVSFLTRGGKLLPGGAFALNLICDKTIRISHAELVKLLLKK